MENSFIGLEVTNSRGNKGKIIFEKENEDGTLNFSVQFENGEIWRYVNSYFKNSSPKFLDSLVKITLKK